MYREYSQHLFNADEIDSMSKKERQQFYQSMEDPYQR